MVFGVKFTAFSKATGYQSECWRLLLSLTDIAALSHHKSDGHA